MSLDKAWGITKIITTLAIPLVALLITNSYNLKQVEISRNKYIAEIIPKLGSEDLSSKEKRAIAISLGVFEKHAISPLIALLEDDDERTRKSAATALMMIGKEVIKPLEQFISNRFILAKYKGEAIILIENLDKFEIRKVTTELLRNMHMDNVSSSASEISEVRNNIHPFIARETVIALHSLGEDLSDAFLEKINLSGAILNGIKLKRAHLREADFSKSKLIDADLSSATLDCAIFDEADISGADFRGAKCEKGATWQGAIGADTAKFDKCVPRGL